MKILLEFCKWWFTNVKNWNTTIWEWYEDFFLVLVEWSRLERDVSEWFWMSMGMGMSL